MFTGTPGVMPGMEDKSPLDFFHLFFTREVMDLLFSETQRYISQYLDREAEYLEQHPQARAHMWHRSPLMLRVGHLSCPGDRYGCLWLSNPQVNKTWYTKCVIHTYIHACTHTNTYKSSLIHAEGNDSIIIIIKCTFHVQPHWELLVFLIPFGFHPPTHACGCNYTDSCTIILPLRRQGKDQCCKFQKGVSN